MLYHKYRPKTFDEIVGNSITIKKIAADLNKKDKPHAFLLSGPTGTGKTTLSRIIATTLGCSENDFSEIDNAQFRGIDSVRELKQKCQFKPTSGKCRVF